MNHSFLSSSTYKKRGGLEVFYRILLKNHRKGHNSRDTIIIELFFKKSKVLQILLNPSFAVPPFTPIFPTWATFATFSFSGYVIAGNSPEPFKNYSPLCLMFLLRVQLLFSWVLYRKCLPAGWSRLEYHTRLVHKYLKIKKIQTL